MLEPQTVMYLPITLCPRSVNHPIMTSYFACSTQKSVHKARSMLQIRHFFDVTKGLGPSPGLVTTTRWNWESGISQWTITWGQCELCQSEWDSQGPSFGTSWVFFFSMFKCRLDLKGLVSGVSLSPTDNVSGHYNDNQASQSSCDNDWD